MRLKSVSYSEYADSERRWVLSGLSMGAVNLLVGKNSSGKTRTLSVIAGLAKLLSGQAKAFVSGTYDVHFIDGNKDINYYLECHHNKVKREEFREGGITRLKRGDGGVGTIYHEKVGKEGSDQDFQTPETDIAAFSRVDNVQHKFLEPLRLWGEGLRFYPFGESLSQRAIALLVKDGPEPDPADFNAVIALFRKGAKDFPEKFIEAVREDMKAIDYRIDDVGVIPPTDVMIQSPFPTNPVVLYVKENDLLCRTEQQLMSKGMFQALGIIIHINFAILAKRPECILIDDIGEGLDFERSSKLIKLIREKAKSAAIQLIMSTNDRFVMNHVPMDEWSVLKRTGGEVRVYNHDNAAAAFEKFRFMGLSNFDFLAYDILGKVNGSSGQLDGANTGIQQRSVG